MVPDRVMIIMKVFHKDKLKYNTSGPRNTDLLYLTEILRNDFLDANFIKLEEQIVELNKGQNH